MQVPLDMTHSQYLPAGGHYSERMQVDPSLPNGPGTSAPQPPVAYQAQHDMAPSSAVSSFNIPATTDSSLLTPVSSAGSPSVQQGHSKPMHSYHPSHIVSSQQPSPPDSSRMYYHYEMDPSSQGSSPMTLQPQATDAQFGVPSYIHQSPKDSVPPPMNPYFGSFGVSGAEDQDDQQQQLQSLTGGYRNYIPPVDVDQSFLMQHQVPMGASHFHRPLGSASNAPILAQPNPSEFRPGRGLGIDNLRDPSLLTARPSPSFASDRSPSVPRKAPKRKPATTRRLTAKRTSSGPSHTQGSAAGSSRPDVEVEELQLRADATPDDKFVFELRKRYNGAKGKGMWCQIQEEYEKHYGNKVEREKLQMQVSRAVLRYAVWPKREEDILLQAYQKAEDEFFNRVLTFMKDMGGCKTWEWKPQHVEMRLVQLGKVEPNVDDQTKVRRRKRAAARRRSTARPQQQTAQQQAQQQLAEWQYHHPMGGPTLMRRPSLEGGASDEMSVTPTFTSEQEEEIAEQILGARSFELEESPVPPPPTAGAAGTIDEGGMDMGGYPGGGDGGRHHHPLGSSRLGVGAAAFHPGGGGSLSQQQSKRVALMACEQLMHHQQHVKREYPGCQ